jgi:transcriptional regulator with XRE-family HTH domain
MQEQKVPNVQLRAWRDSNNLTRAEMADRLSRTPTAERRNLVCDEKRIGKWELGEVLWPRPEYRAALQELTGKDAEALGFIPPHRAAERLVIGTVVPRDALQAEAEVFDTLELTRMAGMSDISTGTIEALSETADLLCRAYPTTPAAILRDRTKKRLKQVLDLLGGHVTIEQHRELYVIAGWMAALLGCVHYDLGEREEAEAARQAAYQWARQAGHGELMGWAFEMSAWFALTEGNFEQLIESAQKGQPVAGISNAGVQLTLQEAKGWAHIGDRARTDDALTRGADMLGKLTMPEHREHHFVFDHTKYAFYAATCYATLGDDDRAEEHAHEVITQHTRRDGTSNAPMRVAGTRIDLAIVAARRGDLDQAVAYGEGAFDFDRKSLTDLVGRTGDLDRMLQDRYRGERLAQDFHDRYLHAVRMIEGRV